MGLGSPCRGRSRVCFFKGRKYSSSEKCGIQDLSQWSLHIGCVPFPLNFLSGAVLPLVHCCFWKELALVLLRSWKQEKRRKALLASCSSSGEPDSVWETRRSWVSVFPTPSKLKISPLWCLLTPFYKSDPTASSQEALRVLDRRLWGSLCFYDH